MRLLPAAMVALVASSTIATAQVGCGGNFASFVEQMKQQAVAQGHSKTTVRSFFAGVRQDPKTLKADRSQGIFQMSFTDFSRRIISENRIQNGRRNAKKWDALFDNIESNYGIPRGVLLAFWAFETDFGAVQGDFNTLNSLMTLANDCRRPDLFRPQVFAALKLYENGSFDPAHTTGAWAGEIGMVQMLPEDILVNGVDADGNGRVDMKTSPPDALTSAAKMLRGLGWRANEPWLQEITVPANLDWAKTGLNTQLSVRQWAQLGVQAKSGKLKGPSLMASVILPQGRNGPAFMAYPNYRVYFEWNKSFVYVTTAAYFATRLSGADTFSARSPDPALSGRQMKSLQQKLAARGYDVGKIDSILGAKTRSAVQSEQIRMGLPADAWPTVRLLNAL